MNKRVYEIFIAVYQTQSISQAAKKLYIAQPSISLTIKQLEDYYGVELFTRIKNRLYLNQYSHIFYKYATNILSLMNECDQKIMDNNIQSTIRLASSITIANNFIPILNKYILDNNLNIKLEYKVTNSSNIEKEILNNNVDIGLIETISNNIDMIQKPFLYDQLVTIANKDFKDKQLTLKQYLTYPLISREKGSAVRDIIDNVMQNYQLPYNPYYQSSDTMAIINAVSNNMGIATLSYGMVKPYLNTKNIKIIKVKELDIRRTYHIIYYKNLFIQQSYQDLIDTIIKLGNSISKYSC